MIKWSNEMLIEEALKYNTRNDFKKGCRRAYNSARNRGILDSICSHMIKQYIKWSDELLKEEASKYNTKISFLKGNTKAYDRAQRRGILDSICKHMIEDFRWSDEQLKNEALRYSDRSSFFKYSGSAYTTARMRGILDDICSHMIRLGDIYNRFIYVIEFENNSVYVGLTCDLERRKLEHIKNSSNKYINEYISNDIKHKFNSDNILYSADDAVKIECSLIGEYKDKGFNVLNINKGGGLGNKKIK